MIALEYYGQGVLSGAEQAYLATRFAGYDRIRQIERASIRAFMEAHRECLIGRVLDFGAGKQPYRDLVDGEYVPFEKEDMVLPEPASCDAVMCNQVVQYLDSLGRVIKGWAIALKPGGFLVMTYPTNWDEVEAADLWRFTKAGMEKLLVAAGFTIVAHERRAEVVIGNFHFPLGYGVIARK